VSLCLCGGIDFRYGQREVLLSELVVLGFSDRYRAEEVLGQLRRLDFSWAPDLESAVAVEVDARGRLSIRHSMALDPTFADTAPAWRALLLAIQPQAVPLQPASKERASESKALNAEASLWQRALMTNNPVFLRDLGAVLRPADSAIFAVVTDGDAAVKVLRGYSSILLRTSLTEAQASKLRTASDDSNSRPGERRSM
jgi:uncharacterized membrane protein